MNKRTSCCRPDWYVFKPCLVLIDMFSSHSLVLIESRCLSRNPVVFFVFEWRVCVFQSTTLLKLRLITSWRLIISWRLVDKPGHSPGIVFCCIRQPSHNPVVLLLCDRQTKSQSCDFVAFWYPNQVAILLFWCFSMGKPRHSSPVILLLFESCVPVCVFFRPHPCLSWTTSGAVYAGRPPSYPSMTSASCVTGETVSYHTSISYRIISDNIISYRAICCAMIWYDMWSKQFLSAACAGGAPSFPSIVSASCVTGGILSYANIISCSIVSYHVMYGVMCDRLANK